MSVPRCNGAVDLPPSRFPQERANGTHERGGRSAFDGGGERNLVARLAWSNAHDRTFEQGSDSLDHITVRHRDSNDGDPWTRRDGAHESGLALEDAHQPVKILLVYIGVCVVGDGNVSIGPISRY
jgi:hypothetical protein